MAKVVGVSVVLHDDTVSREHVLCSSKLLPIGGVAWLYAPHTKRLCIVAKVPTRNADEVSVHVTIGKKFGFENRMKATIEVIEDKIAATATHVELFHNQHLSRADMWRMEAELDTSALYTGQRLSYLGSTVATVDSVYIASEQVDLVDSACIRHPHTKLIFRSGSARYIVLIQVSIEMLEYWIDGDLMYERIIDGFLPDLFSRWEETKARHHISVVLFGRRAPEFGQSDTTSKAGIQSRDFFHVITADVSSTDPSSIVRSLKEAFNHHKLPRDVCLAAKGNMLEAISIAAMSFVHDNVDPHLATTGSAIIAITAGRGVFEADHELLRKTTRLLMGNSVGVDLVALAPKPDHPVPLFSYVNEGITEYALPHWADISYWPSGYDDSKSNWLLPGALPSIKDVSIPQIELASSSNLEDAQDTWDEQLFGSKFNPPAVNSSRRLDTFKLKITDNGHNENNLVGFAKVQSLKPGSRPESPMAGRPTSSYAGSVSSLRMPKRSTASPHPLLRIGPGGLALGSGVASISVSTQHAEHEKDNVKSSGTGGKSNTSGIAKQIRASLQKETVQEAESSKPIEIQTNEDSKSKTAAHIGSIDSRASLLASGSGDFSGGASLASTPKANGVPTLPPIDPDEEYQASMFPWLTIINPCNPQQQNMRVASEFRQWQNVFPRAVGPDTFRWESMCTPAVLPLLRQSRMSLTDLMKYFNKDVRPLVSANESAHAAMTKMIALRLAFGFQIVPTRQLRDTQMSSQVIEDMLLSLGDQYHRLTCLSDQKVDVEIFQRPISDLVSPISLDYSAMIQPIIGSEEQLRVCDLATRSAGGADWPDLDMQCASSTNEDVGNIKMRLVLIPVALAHADPLHDPHIRDTAHEETQERRIEGIQKLTQLWQRNRYFTIEEQQHHASLSRARSRVRDDQDLDPLAIEYQTKDPSAVVSTFGATTNGESASNAAHTLLFPKSDMYHSSTFDIHKLLKHMQEPPPVGVEMKDRRWLARFHLKCFRGDEMTTWLLSVFKNIGTRADAVAIGNELLKKDIFTHVRGKHAFRDGNYFFQINAAYRTTAYPDTTGIFGKGIGRSVPFTPVTELRQSPTVRAIQGDSDSSSKGSPTPTLGPIGSPQIPTVLLSQKLRYNVDPSRRSSQFELVNLHYDRIHNPDNCYHILLDWTTTTPKLIHEAVQRWASLVDRHGLKLVQLPVKEGSKVHLQHPLEQPIYVKMALKPVDDKIPETPLLAPQSASPRVGDDTTIHHKAVLRHMGFVLDLEAAKTFSRRLNVTYSWGAPEFDYTQFIHRSGLLLAQITNDGESDFVLIRNPLATQSPSSHKHFDSSTSKGIATKFVKFCEDPRALKHVYEELKQPKVSPFSPLVKTPWTADSDVPPMELPPHLINRPQR